ncbi:GPP34-domain-containing protein [Hymenopellis radicata]|nr:GPP34-domain-containing protein [Hymenopellis radicata]
MSAGGLQRRRGAASMSSSPTTPSGEGNGSSLGNGNGHPERRQTEWAGAVHAGSAFAGGSKIAYDPRDLVGADEQTPKLTLMEEVLLLGIKDKQGYLSFWNDNISYALRGCILIELALRRRIGLLKPSAPSASTSPYSAYQSRSTPLADRLVVVLNPAQTGETLLDETLRMMHAQQNPNPPPAPGATDERHLGVNAWIDLLSGETWNVMKIGFQLKQVRERLAKGLVDKGVLRTEKRNFLLFDMATHPVADVRTKEDIVRRVVALVSATTSSVPKEAAGEPGMRDAVLRAVCLVCASYTASVLDNAFGRLGYEEREAAFGRADEILAEFSVWPYGGEGAGASSSTPGRRKGGSRIAMGSTAMGGRVSLAYCQR